MTVTAAETQTPVPQPDKIAALQPSCVIWNGDANNSTDTVEQQKKIFLQPEMDRRDYAANIPYLFAPGNHDDRGIANWHLERVWMYRQPEERSSRDWDLGRNFAVRMGDIAMIGLDTAEDKVDTNPRMMVSSSLFATSLYSTRIPVPIPATSCPTIKTNAIQQISPLGNALAQDYGDRL